MRIGHGFDVHSFGKDNPLIICGVLIPYKKGILAYSDGDIALHALMDALLGAVALGDIGKNFPDTNKAYKKINSRILLKEVMRKIAKKNYKVGNIDMTILAQAPYLLPYINKMRINIAEDLDSSVDQINIKATTTENLGFIGREEGIACAAVALLIQV